MFWTKGLSDPPVLDPHPPRNHPRDSIRTEYTQIWMGLLSGVILSYTNTMGVFVGFVCGVYVSNIYPVINISSITNVVEMTLDYITVSRTTKTEK